MKTEVIQSFEDEHCTTVGELTVRIVLYKCSSVDTGTHKNSGAFRSSLIVKIVKTTGVCSSCLMDTVACQSSLIVRIV